MLSTAHSSPLISDPILDAAVGELARIADVERIILFGSRPRADARADSDYDLLVIFGAAHDARGAESCCGGQESSPTTGG